MHVALHKSMCQNESESISPFQNEIQPVSHHSHPDEFNTHISPQMKPNGKKHKEGGVEIRHRGDPVKQLLQVSVLRLKMDGYVHAPAVKQVHLCRLRSGWKSARELHWRYSGRLPVLLTSSFLDFIQGYLWFCLHVCWRTRGPSHLVTFHLR